MINSQELNNRGVSNSQDTKQEQENKKETRLNQINSNSPEILTNSIYTPAFLRQQIGKLMRVEFLIGTNNLTDRIGFLEDVGASYILLRSFEGDSQIYADIYAIKFSFLPRKLISPRMYTVSPFVILLFHLVLIVSCISSRFTKGRLSNLIELS